MADETGDATVFSWMYFLPVRGVETFSTDAWAEERGTGLVIFDAFTPIIADVGVKKGNVGAMTHGEAGVEPAGGALLLLRPLTQARSRRADVLAGSLAGEDPLVQTARGQNVFLVHPTERQTAGAGDHRTRGYDPNQ